MNDFLLLLRGGDENIKGFSPQQMQQHMQKYFSWVEELSGAGQYKGGMPLEIKGKTIEKETMIIDKPMVESKETIGGYFLITARDLDHAAEIALGCPVLTVGGSVEVRQIQPVE